jgi:DNA-binding CsgD family transcriptional regulator
VGASDAAGDRRGRTFAHVDLQLSPLARSSSGGRHSELASSGGLHRPPLEFIERTVRSGDRVCPYGVSRIVVAFGPDAEAVAPNVLGRRLARAVSQSLDEGRDGGDRQPATLPDGQPGTPVPGANGSGRPNATSGPGAVIVVDRMLGRSASVADRWPAAPLLSATAEDPVRRLRRRTLVACTVGRPGGYGARHDDVLPAADDRQTLGAVLVVDPDPTATGMPGLAALATCTSAEGLGFKVGVISLPGDAEPVAEVDGVALDLVVLMVGSEPDGTHLTWSSSTWCIPAQLTAAYHALGIDVLAVSAGAGAGALAGCLEQGASVLFELNALPDELSALGRTGSLSTERTIDRNSPGLPASLQSLLQLTSSERRVLFYLTGGRSAQEIADELVISLATVRSHIRSILRKLGVRSQLAAVAVANRRGHNLSEPVHSK